MNEEIKFKDEKLASILLEEEARREKLYDAPTIIDELEENFVKKYAPNPQKAIGVILDKLTLAREFIQLVPLYYDTAQIFWMWDNKKSRWKMVDETEILSWIDHNASVNVVSTKEKSEIMNAIKIEARRNRPLDILPTAIQFNKEIVNLETGDRIPASPKFFTTNPLPHRIGKSTDTPTFDKLFVDWVGEKEAKTLYEVLAYCMLPSYPIERIVCLHGSGSNGKSCFLKILKNFIGIDNVCSTDLETLVTSRFEKSRLYKKLVCEMGETNLAKIENTQIIKKLVSGKDMIGMEIKNKQLFETINYAKLIIATNNIPPTDDKTDGFYRRWLIIDFPNRFNTEIDVLASIGQTEYENLAAKCIGILDDLLKRRAFSTDGTIEQRRERYEEKSNPFDKFFSQFISEEANGDIPKWEFEKRFNEWLTDNKLRKMSDISIARIMKAKGINEVRLMKQWFENGHGTTKQFRCWSGIQWKK